MYKKALFLGLVIISLIPSCRQVTSADSIFSLLISKDDHLISENYFNHKTPEDYSNVQSLTKGIISILVGIAIDNQFLLNENEPIEKYFPIEFEHIDDVEKRKITIKDLLNQTSGLEWNGFREHSGWLKSDDPIGYVLNKKLENNPGEIYNYNSGATHLLSVIISRSSGLSTLEFANDYLFDALFIDSVQWEKRNDGYYDGAGLGLSIRPIDLLAIGKLLENNGEIDGKYILSKAWVNKLFNETEKSATLWGLRDSTHGFCWYKSILNGHDINYGMGYGGQFIIIVPDSELVIVTTHNHDTANGLDQQRDFLQNELPALIEKYK